MAELLDRLRTEREAREVRLEHWQVKWLLQRWRRYWKDVTGQRQGRWEMERVKAHGDAPAVEPEVHELVAGQLLQPTLLLEGKEERADALVELIDGKLEETGKGVTLEDLDRWLAEKRQGADVEPVEGEPRTKKGPLERGSMLPTVAEYLRETLPGYITTEEEALRELEFRTALKTYRQAAAARAARPGPAVCQGVPLEARGHVWWKVPCQPAYECIECGLEVSTLRWDLQAGKLKPLGLTGTREFGKMKEAIEGKRFEFLLPSGQRPESPKELAAYEARNRLMPLIPAGLEDAASRIKQPSQRTEWVGGSADAPWSGPCQNCGSILELHRPDLDIAGRLYCPQEGIDIT